MAGQKITCTECDASLTVSDPVAPGKKIRCPKCQAIFRIPETALEAAPAKSKLARRPEVDDADRDDDYDSRPSRGRRRQREKTGMGAGVLIGIIAASVLLMGGVGFGVFWLVNSWHENQLAEEQAKLAVLVANGLPAVGGAGPQVGQPAPEIEAEDIDGQKFKLSDYRGKVVVLDFWGNW